MSAIHVVVRPLASEARSPALAPLFGLIDVLVDGVNLTARIGDSHVLLVLGELGLAVAHLASGRTERTTLALHTESEPWELGLEADGADVLLTVFRTGPAPDVAVFERRVPLAALRSAVLDALAEVPAARAPRPVTSLVAAARTALETCLLRGAACRAERSEVTLGSRSIGGLYFAAKAQLRHRPAPTAAARSDSQLERADLHALLARGEFSVCARRRITSLGGVHLFLLAEKLLLLADDALEAHRAARPVFRRVELGSVRLGVRQTGEGAGLCLSVSGPELVARGESISFPEIEPSAFVRCAAQFAQSLAEALVKHDPSQAKNLRLIALQSMAAGLNERVSESERDDSLTNAQPESYRAFGLPRSEPGLAGRWEHGGKMRFMPRWVATVPGIDLRSTFLCGDRIVVGSARETASIERSSGRVLWRMTTPRAAAVATPLGPARLHPDGTIVLHDLETGEVRFSTVVPPRAGGGACGAVVHVPGLPKLLVVVEGDRRVTAIDLVSGDVRWRFTARRPANFRLRRAGKLLLVAGGDSALVALDVSTGDVVWRVRDRLPFTGDLCIDHDSVFALCGGPIGPVKMHRIDPWSGELRWTRELEERPVSGQPPVVAGSIVAAIVRDRRGVGVQAFDRATGEPIWQQTPGLAAPTTAWLGIDGALIANSAAGTLLCLDAASGNLRYNHVFARHVEADQPRRLEPVLRSGALFVPQHQVHVVRPRDGEILGTLPTDLIPDFLRVDERCDVYVAEESGHLAAFGAAARLTLVK
jgi:outer membrane protein assembly factor BamB